ncbi:MAG: hypothetical protein JSS93_06650 [Bacteroidetes bacterium]|nr:hypothetical protein [Bacteroidota bacterium]
MKTVQIPMLLFLMALLGATAFPLLAQQEKGDEQIAGQFLYQTSTPNGNGIFTGIVTASWFATKHIEWGLSGTYSGGTGFTFNDLAPFINYNILSKNGKFVFYLGATVDFTNTTSEGQSSSNTGYGGKGGFRIYATENIFYLIEQKVYDPNDGTGNTNLLTTVGIGILLKKKK